MLMNARQDRRLLLEPHDLEIVVKILKQYLPEYAIWAFGSRVRGGAKKFSDLDLVVVTTEPLSLEKLADVEEAFDQSDLPFKVDIVDWASTTEAFRNIINECKVVLL